MNLSAERRQRDQREYLLAGAHVVGKGATLPLLPCRALQRVSTMAAPADALWPARSGLRRGALGAEVRCCFGIGVSTADRFNLGEQGGVDGGGNDSALLTPSSVPLRSCLAGCAAAGPRGGEKRSSSWLSWSTDEAASISKLEAALHFSCSVALLA